MGLTDSNEIATLASTIKPMNPDLAMAAPKPAPCTNCQAMAVANQTQQPQTIETVIPVTTKSGNTENYMPVTLVLGGGQASNAAANAVPQNNPLTDAEKRDLAIKIAGISLLVIMILLAVATMKKKSKSSN